MNARLRNLDFILQVATGFQSRGHPPPGKGTLFMTASERLTQGMVRAGFWMPRGWGSSHSIILLLSLSLYPFHEQVAFNHLASSILLMAETSGSQKVLNSSPVLNNPGHLIFGPIIDSSLPQEQIVVSLDLISSKRKKARSPSLTKVPCLVLILKRTVTLLALIMWSYCNVLSKAEFTRKTGVPNSILEEGFLIFQGKKKKTCHSNLHE